MKIFIKMQGAPIDQAILHDIRLLGDFVRVDNPTDAELCIVADKQTLLEIHSAYKQFIVISMPNDKPENLPANAEWIDILQIMSGFAEFLKKYKAASQPVPRAQVIACKRYDPEKITERTLKVLVVDDTEDNLKLALEQLSQHYVTLASGYAQAMELLEGGNKYGAVLTDLYMPAVLTKGSPLSADAVELDKPVPIGLFLIFAATRHGAKVAVVTDANHHKDWASALFDNLRDCDVVNGEDVMFFNNIGKRWDFALSQLMLWDE